MARDNQYTNVITEKQKKACQYYLDTKSDTYQNKVKSYLKAGYKDTPNKFSAAVKFFQTGKVVQYLNELRQAEIEQEGKKSLREQLNEDYTLEHAKNLLAHCLANGDTTNAVKLVTLFSDINGMRTTNTKVDQTNHEITNLTPQELEALEAIARANNIRLSNKTG